MGPWWLGIGAAIVTSLVAVIGKLWATIGSERANSATQLAQKDWELQQANDRIVELQQRGKDEHVRDLRRMAGLSHSIDPPRPDPWPPVVIRAAPTRPGPPPRKRG